MKQLIHKLILILILVAFAVSLIFLLKSKSSSKSQIENAEITCDEIMNSSKVSYWDNIFKSGGAQLNQLRNVLSNNSCNLTNIDEMFVDQNETKIFFKENEKFLLPSQVKSWSDVSLEECKEKYANDLLDIKQYVSLSNEEADKLNDVCFLSLIRGIKIKKFHYSYQLLKIEKNYHVYTIAHILSRVKKDKKIIFLEPNNNVFFISNDYHDALLKIKDYLDKVLQIPVLPVYYCDGKDQKLETLEQLKDCKKTFVMDGCSWEIHALEKATSFSIEKLLWYRHCHRIPDDFLDRVAIILRSSDLKWEQRRQLWQHEVYRTSLSDYYFPIVPHHEYFLLHENGIFKFPNNVKMWNKVSVRQCTFDYAKNQLKLIPFHTKSDIKIRKIFDACVLFYIQREQMQHPTSRISLKNITTTAQIIRIKSKTSVDKVVDTLKIMFKNPIQVIVLDEEDKLIIHDKDKRIIVSKVEEYLEKFGKKFTAGHFQKLK